MHAGELVEQAAVRDFFLKPNTRIPSGSWDAFRRSVRAGNGERCHPSGAESPHCTNRQPLFRIPLRPRPGPMPPRASRHEGGHDRASGALLLSPQPKPCRTANPPCPGRRRRFPGNAARAVRRGLACPVPLRIQPGTGSSVINRGHPGSEDRRTQGLLPGQGSRSRGIGGQAQKRIRQSGGRCEPGSGPQLHAGHCRRVGMRQDDTRQVHLPA